MPRVSIKKNYYELKKSERREYMEEFNDIHYIKGVKGKKDITVYFLFIFLVLFLISKFIDFDILIPCFCCYLKYVTLATFVYYLFLESYYRISFMRWLKIKYKVEY